MLIDMLGVLVGFVTVMLLLSLLVTALAEAAKALFGLREGNLRLSLRALLDDLQEATSNQADPKAGDARSDIPENGLIAESVLIGSRLGTKPKLLQRATGRSTPPVTAIKLATLEHEVKRCYKDGWTDDVRENLRKRYPVFVASSKARFEHTMRWITIVISVGVAFVMQVSASSLLERLWSDASYRAQLVAVGEQYADRERDQVLVEDDRYEEVSDEVLVKLAERHPGATDLIEAASGMGIRRVNILDELDMVLTDAAFADRDAILRDYASMLDEQHLERFGYALSRVAETSSQLTALDITAWRNGWRFYADFGNIIGVLITAILISLGGPFWYDLLQLSVTTLRSTRSRLGGDKAVAGGATVFGGLQTVEEDNQD